MKSAVEHIDKVAGLIGAKVEELGGGLKGFTFTLPDGRCLVFSHSDGPLGYALDSADGVNLKWESMDDPNAGAEEQAKYVRRICREHGANDLPN